MICLSHYTSPLCEIQLAELDGKLCGLRLEGQPPFSYPNTVKKDTQVLIRMMMWLDRYFSGEKPEIPLSELAPAGSAFQKTVWELLCEIPYGKVTSYKEIAEVTAAKTGRARMSAQAVGGAVGRNPIALIIPCHRVIGADGSLTGYAGGIDLKEKLLRHEGAGNRFFFFKNSN